MLIARKPAPVGVPILGHWSDLGFNPKFSPNRLVDTFDQVVEPLIAEIT